MTTPNKLFCCYKPLVLCLRKIQKSKQPSTLVTKKKCLKNLWFSRKNLQIIGNFLASYLIFFNFFLKTVITYQNKVFEFFEKLGYQF